MTISMTWGGSAITPLPDNEGLEAAGHFIGSAARMADGSLRVDKIAEKRKIEMHWTGLLYAELAAIRVIYDAKASASNALAYPDTRSWNVIGIHGGWREGKVWEDSAGVLRYELTLAVEEV